MDDTKMKKALDDFKRNYETMVSTKQGNRIVQAVEKLSFRMGQAVSCAAKPSSSGVQLAQSVRELAEATATLSQGLDALEKYLAEVQPYVTGTAPAVPAAAAVVKAAPATPAAATQATSVVQQAMAAAAAAAETPAASTPTTAAAFLRGRKSLLASAGPPKPRDSPLTARPPTSGNPGTSAAVRSPLKKRPRLTDGKPVAAQAAFRTTGADKANLSTAMAGSSSTVKGSTTNGLKGSIRRSANCNKQHQKTVPSSSAKENRPGPPLQAAAVITAEREHQRPPTAPQTSFSKESTPTASSVPTDRPVQAGLVKMEKADIKRLLATPQTIHSRENLQTPTGTHPQRARPSLNGWLSGKKQQATEPHVTVGSGDDEEIECVATLWNGQYTAIEVPAKPTVATPHDDPHAAVSETIEPTHAAIAGPFVERTEEEVEDKATATKNAGRRKFDKKKSRYAREEARRVSLEQLPPLHGKGCTGSWECAMRCGKETTSASEIKHHMDNEHFLEGTLVARCLECGVRGSLADLNLHRKTEKERCGDPGAVVAYWYEKASERDDKMMTEEEKEERRQRGITKQLAIELRKCMFAGCEELLNEFATFEDLYAHHRSRHNCIVRYICPNKNCAEMVFVHPMRFIRHRGVKEGEACTKLIPDLSARYFRKESKEEEEEEEKEEEDEEESDEEGFDWSKLVCKCRKCTHKNVVS